MIQRKIFFKSTRVLLDNKSQVGDKSCGICDFLITNLFIILVRELKINYKFIGHMFVDAHFWQNGPMANKAQQHEKDGERKQ